MTIDTQDVARFLQEIKKQYEALAYSEFNDGVRAGMEIALQYIKLYEEREGTNIAKERGL